MPISKTLQNFLDKNKIKYEPIEHRTVFTALDKAATLKAKPATIGKTVIISLDGKDHALGLIPANRNLDKKKLLKAANNSRGRIRVNLRYSHADFADEKWMKNNIRGVKLGATPPFSALYKLPFFIDNLLIKQPKIIINAGDYETSLKITPDALLKINQDAIKGNFSQAKK